MCSWCRFTPTFFVCHRRLLISDVQLLSFLDRKRVRIITTWQRCTWNISKASMPQTSAILSALTSGLWLALFTRRWCIFATTAVFINNKQFFCYMWQWWTLQYECYCCALICSLSLHLHVAGDYNIVLESTFGVLESAGKVLEFILGKTVGTLFLAVCLFIFFCCPVWARGL